MTIIDLTETDDERLKTPTVRRHPHKTHVPDGSRLPQATNTTDRLGGKSGSSNTQQRLPAAAHSVESRSSTSHGVSDEAPKKQKYQDQDPRLLKSGSGELRVNGTSSIKKENDATNETRNGQASGDAVNKESVVDQRQDAGHTINHAAQRSTENNSMKRKADRDIDKSDSQSLKRPKVAMQQAQASFSPSKTTFTSSQERKSLPVTNALNSHHGFSTSAPRYDQSHAERITSALARKPSTLPSIRQEQVSRAKPQNNGSRQHAQPSSKISEKPQTSQSQQPSQQSSNMSEKPQANGSQQHSQQSSKVFEKPRTNESRQHSQQSSKRTDKPQDTESRQRPQQSSKISEKPQTNESRQHSQLSSRTSEKPPASEPRKHSQHCPHKSSKMLFASGDKSSAIVKHSEPKAAANEMLHQTSSVPSKVGSTSGDGHPSSAKTSEPRAAANGSLQQSSNIPSKIQSRISGKNPSPTISSEPTVDANGRRGGVSVDTKAQGSVTHAKHSNSVHKETLAFSRLMNQFSPSTSAAQGSLAQTAISSSDHLINTDQYDFRMNTTQIDPSHHVLAPQIIGNDSPRDQTKPARSPIWDKLLSEGQAKSQTQKASQASQARKSVVPRVASSTSSSAQSRVSSPGDAFVQNKKGSATGSNLKHTPMAMSDTVPSTSTTQPKPTDTVASSKSLSTPGDASVQNEKRSVASPSLDEPPVATSHAVPSASTSQSKASDTVASSTSLSKPGDASVQNKKESSAGSSLIESRVATSRTVSSASVSEPKANDTVPKESKLTEAHTKQHLMASNPSKTDSVVDVGPSRDNLEMAKAEALNSKSIAKVPATNAKVMEPPSIVVEPHTKVNGKHAKFADMPTVESVIEEATMKIASNRKATRSRREKFAGAARKSFLTPAETDSTVSARAGHSDSMSFAQVRTALQKELLSLREDHNYTTKTSLTKARTSSTIYRHHHVAESSSSKYQTACHNGMTGLRHESSPFKSIKASIDASQTHITGRTKMTLEVLDLSGKKIKGPMLYMGGSSQTWVDNEPDVPFYTHCDTIKQNVIGPNQKQLHNYPYFGEQATDEVYSTLFDWFCVDVEERKRKLKRAQQSHTYRPYLEAFLESVGCTEATILFYLLSRDLFLPSNHEAFRDRERSCKEDFDRDATRWQLIFSKIATPTSEQLKRAAFACTAFFNLTGFSIWAVVRKSKFADMSQPEVPNLDINELQRRACRICHAHDCPYHGDFKERVDYDTDDGASECSSLAGAEAMDIDWPPEINFKRHVSAPFPQHQHRDNIDDQGAARVVVRDKTSYQQLLKLTRQKAHHDRKVFFPCHHPGFSCMAAKCKCFRDNALCEKACGCSGDCERRYQGCYCNNHNIRKICYQDDRCDCFKLSRECDPDLCGTCGVHLALDPENRDDDEIQKQNCHNAPIQLGLSKRTILGKSKIHGFGLYAGEAMKAKEFVGEYKGEVVLGQEKDRRAAIYDVLHESYLFMLTLDEEIDSKYAGSKTRYINHASNDGKNGPCNIGVKILLCNMVPRIGMYANRDIEAGEELFFNYGNHYPEHYVSGAPAATSSTPKSAPGVRNSGRVSDFIEPEYSEDEYEDGNRRLSKRVKPRAKSKRKAKVTIVSPEPTQLEKPRTRAKRSTQKSTAVRRSSINSRSKVRTPNGTSRRHAVSAGMSRADAVMTDIDDEQARTGAGRYDTQAEETEFEPHTEREEEGDDEDDDSSDDELVGGHGTRSAAATRMARRLGMVGY